MSVFKSRFQMVAVLMCILMVLLFVRLFGLTVLEYDRWSTAAVNISTQSVFTPAPRGEIFDRHGRLLAGNVQRFSLRFTTSGLTSAEANEVAAKLVEVLERNGDTYYDNLPILIENGTFVYTFQQDIEEWLDSREMPVYYTAQQAFDRLREIYVVPARYDEFEAQADLQNRHNVFPPISVRHMKFLRDMDREAFLQRYGLRTDLTAEEAFQSLRIIFGIDRRERTPDENGERPIIRSEISDEQAREIIVVRNEVSARGFRRYIPATIASSISQSTIVQIEEMSRNLPGVQIVSETKRVYPHGSTASHIIGYMGRISEQELPRFMDDERYSPNDLVGLDGIERAKETYLKGTPGIKDVQVNVRGELVRVIEEREPVKGRDVYLTIDLELQKTAERALAHALEQIRVGGVFESEFGNYRFRQFPQANVGAVVVLDVQTGEVLAMASYPDYDPNLFTDGISRADWNSLQSQNPRDPLAPAPLYNVAARSTQAPGSAFKMLTAVAALSSGLDPMMPVRDSGFVMVAGRPFGCLLWHRTGGNHGNVNLAQALEVSCNVYFYNIAVGRDIATGRCFGYTSPIDIDVIMHYARQFGLGVPTGIEISEARTSIPSSESRMRQTKSSLANALRARAERFFEPEVVADRDRLEAYIAEIVSWTYENPSRNEVIRRMANVGVREEMIVSVAEFAKFSYFNFARWSLGDELNIAIGQGENAYTPLQMAKFMATLGNGGVRNDVTLISAIEGMQIERTPGVRVDFDHEQGMAEIIRGMNLATTGSRGTLTGSFGNFPVQVAAKTGTAERGGRIHPPCEVEYVQANLRRIAPHLQWEDVEAEMTRLMREFPQTWRSTNTAVRQALRNLDNRITFEMIDAHKPTYDPFAWVVAIAPADNPQIAVSVLLFQGGTSLNAGPVAREVIGKYLQLNRQYQDINLDSART